MRHCGEASSWRGLIAALARAGVRVTFFERGVPYYASHRDLAALVEAYRGERDGTRTHRRAASARR